MKTAFRVREPIAKILTTEGMEPVEWYSQSLDKRTQLSPATEGGWCNVMMCQWALLTASGMSSAAFWDKMQTEEMAALLRAKGEEKLAKKETLLRSEYV